MKLTTRWIWVLAFTGLGAVLGGGWIYRRLTRAAPESVEVRARELVQTIVSSGQLMPPAEVRQDSLLTSTVKQILAREGDTAHAGDVLLLLTALRSQTAPTTMIRFFVLVTVAIGIASVLVVSVIQRAAAFPALRASRLDPAEAMRHG